MSLESCVLSSLAPWLKASRWHLAFSGGLDSTVLLHLLVRIGEQHNLPPLSAIHIHHGLQTVADAWPAHCAAVCERLGVVLDVVRVQVEIGTSLERAARDARYAAFGDRLGKNQVLLTAQHRDDQAETVLFRLLRGAGVRGLSAMPASRSLGQGTLVRPLLNIDREALEAYALAHDLQWIEDPSNQCLDHSRNYLRQEVMPVISRRWPRASSSMALAAARMVEAQALLDEMAVMDLDSARAPGRFPWLTLPSLSLSALQALSPARQRNALRHWLSAFTQMPDYEHWAGWESLRDAAVDATPSWRLAGGEIRRGDGRVWWIGEEWLAPLVGPVDWPHSSDSLALPNNGHVQLDMPVCANLQIRYRQGGEILDLPGRGRRDLKRLFNEAGIPGFVRGRIPLLFRDGTLVAVANLPHLANTDLRPVWTPPTGYRV